MLPTRVIASVTTAVLATGLAAAPATATPSQQDQPTLVAVKASHQRGYDRLEFRFRGGLPDQRSARYVSRVIADPSGLPMTLSGGAFLRIRFADAVGHDEEGNVTYGAVRRTYKLPQVIQLANAGDFEGVLSFGLAVSRKERVRVSTRPGRVFVDISTPFRTVAVKDYFLDSDRFATGQEPYTRGVRRPVPASSPAKGALQRLFAGPTASERARGLRFVSSRATGFKNLSIRKGVARVTLTGGCSSGGSTFTVADEITRTLKQFSGVRWVKVYDPSGRTERPAGRSDSIPTCLEP
ncbi:GerMN domain-containing protein [Actinocorallia sp. B10E7]|uniref:GerMN domain-containing protein n=1 Tax=Actinocorallia sp. B10E7 TaxID=3153558 RepID=UPI00325D201F